MNRISLYPAAGILALLLLIMSSLTYAQQAVFVPYEPGKETIINRAACLNFAGTSTQSLVPGTMSTHAQFLYPGDSLLILHQGGQIINDPDLSTPAGISYVFYQCAPTATGPLVSNIVNDPCNYSGAPGQGVYLVLNATIAGNAYFSNSGMAGIIGNNNLNYEGIGNPVEIWFAPVTMDAHVTNANLITESSGTPNECVHVNTADAFSVTYLNHIAITNNGPNELQGSIDIEGGLSEFNGSLYSVVIENDADPLVTGTITAGIPEHGGTLTYTVPQAGAYTITATDTTGGVASITVFHAQTLTASSFVSAPILCFGDSTGTLGLTVSGGISPYTFELSNQAGTIVATGSVTAPGDTVYVSGLPAGQYTFTVTDDIGNQVSTTQIQLSQPSFLAAGISASGNSTCFGFNDGFLQVTASGGVGPYSYLWSNGDTTATTSDLSPGNYSVTVTDNNGCTNTASSSVSEPLALALDGAPVITDASCSGSEDGSISITVDPNTGTAPYQYAWNTVPLQTTQTAVNLNPGTYQVTVTDANSCTAEFTNFTVSTNVVIILDVDGTDPSCFAGNNGSIEITPSGSTNLPYSYDWSANAATGNSAIASNLGEGTYSVTVYDATGVCNAETTISLTAPPELIVSTTASQDPSCFGFNDGSISISASGGTTATGQYSYLWSNGATTANITGLTAGSYTVEVTDDNGCMTPLTVILSDPPQLMITSITPSPVVCFGDATGSINVMVTGGTGAYSFSWDPALPNTGNPTGLPAGFYAVTVTDANGCTAEADVTITEPNPIEIQLSGASPLCHNQQTGVLLAAASGGTGPFTFGWSNGGNTPQITNLPPGQYIVTVTDAAGCTAVADTVLINPAAISISFTNVTGTTCYNTSDGSATAVASGGTTPYSFIWDNNETGATAIQLNQGYHQVTVTDDNGCTRIDSVFVPGPNPISPGNPVVNNVSCFGGDNGSVVVNPLGGTPPYSYNWVTLPGETGNAISGLSAGVYVLVITDDNGCSSPTISITVGQPPVLGGSISNTPVNCFGGSTGTASVVPTGGTVPYFYMWNDPLSQTTSTATNLSAGQYQVVITDANGCTDTLFTTLGQNDSIQFFIDSMASPSCYGYDDGYVMIDSVVLGGVGPYTFSNGGVFFQPFNEFMNLSSGYYLFAVQDSLGCTSEFEVFIDQPPPVTVNAGPDQTVMLGEAANIQIFTNPDVSLLSLNWSPPVFLSCTNCPNPSASPLETTTYMVTATDSTGCTGTDQLTIFIDRTRNVFIPNIFSPNGDGNNDVFMVYAGSSVRRIVTMQIFDRWGGLVFSRNNFAPNDMSLGWNGTSRTRDLNAGVYIYYIEVEFLDGDRIPYRGDVTLIK